GDPAQPPAGVEGAEAPLDVRVGAARLDGLLAQGRLEEGRAHDVEEGGELVVAQRPDGRGGHGVEGRSAPPSAPSRFPSPGGAAQARRRTSSRPIAAAVATSRAPTPPSRRRTAPSSRRDGAGGGRPRAPARP